ncbi:RING-H2 finger protein ATL2 [Rutidosis leptorrhynchoides]|uniref:RING-H2 finger protein ATL2 n=1 Tax=Rutidosis leptorrhynchoides TaxID=125765 RepID=UPI003A99DBC9
MERQPLPNSEADPREFDLPDSYSDSSFALSGKIMLSAIVILFFVVLVMVCLHLYARWYLIRARRRQASRRRRATSHNIIFYDNNTTTSANATCGLDSSVINSLPVFTYSDKEKPLDCAVCLSEFEENESGRVLPKCNHSFHIECIDMWLHSHSTCPMCRAPVERFTENRDQVVLTVLDGSGIATVEPDSCSDSGSSYEEKVAGTSSSSKPAQIDIQRRNLEEFENELNRGAFSPANQSFRSPMSRMLSFTRMLSRERRSNATELPDIECGSHSSRKDQTEADSVAATQ